MAQGQVKQIQTVPFFNYRAFPVPDPATCQYKIDRGEPDPMDKLMAELSELSRTGKAAQVMVVGQWIVVGEIAGYYAVEPAILPGMMMGQPTKPGRGNGS